MNSGCICCSLVGDFGAALKQVLADYTPARIVIEPSGVGKLSDVVAAVERVQAEAPDLHLNSFVTVVDAGKAKIYMKNFGEFFNDQVEHACAIILSRTQKIDQKKLDTAVALLREKNPKAAILTTPWDQLTGAQILSAMEGGRDLAHELMEEIAHEDHGRHHHHEHEHEHHHEHEHEHEHHHEHGEETCDCCCGHEHHHHHDHDADEVFTSWGRETPRKYSREELQEALSALAMTQDYGYILRAKGMVPCEDGQAWLHFDLTPEEFEIREGGADYTGRLCVIGSDLKEDRLEKLFLLA
jgi:G3E family GTPase